MIRFFLLTLTITLAFAGCKKTSESLSNDINEMVETGPLFLKQDPGFNNASLNALYVTLPARYSETTKKYPLLISLHGAGQIGTTKSELSLLVNDGIAKLINDSKFPANFHVNGKNYSFIILNPQFKSYPSTQDIEDILLYARETYRVDNSRTYLAGLSMGGFVASQMGGDFTSQLAAIVPVSGATTDSLACRHIAEGRLPVWSFHNSGDPGVDVATTKTFISLIKSYQPAVVPRLTIFDASVHDAWTRAMDPNYKENGVNIYEWMLQYSK